MGKADTLPLSHIPTCQGDSFKFFLNYYHLGHNSVYHDVNIQGFGRDRSPIYLQSSQDTLH